MKIRKYIGNTVKEAIKAVKEDLGPDALILGTKKARDGRYEVTAAVDFDIAGGPVLSNATDPRGAYAREASKGAPQVNAGKFKAQAAPGASGVPVEKTVARADQIMPGQEKARVNALEKELAELKDLCWTLVGSSRNPEREVFARIEEEMLANGLDRRLARKILSGAFKAVSAEMATDMGYIKSFIRKEMAPRVEVSDPLSKGGVFAFVGPAGAGKTTTIAKLAAVHALRGKRKVALLSMDTYRIAAAEQLRTYGRIMGLPVEIAKTSEELKSFIALHGDKDLVLIDTAGRSSTSRGHMEELRGLSSVSPALKLNLVLSSQMRDEALYSTVKAFGPSIDALTFTKLDEGSERGPIINAAILAGRPVSYLAAGQRVPEDIEVATREKLLGYLIPN